MKGRFNPLLFAVVFFALLSGFGKKSVPKIPEQANLVVLEKSYRNSGMRKEGERHDIMLFARLTSDTLSLNILNYPMNCCVDSIGVKLNPVADTLIMRINEYMDDPCECFTKFDLSLKIANSVLEPAYYRIYKADNPKPHWEGIPEK